MSGDQRCSPVVVTNAIQRKLLATQATRAAVHSPLIEIWFSSAPVRNVGLRCLHEAQPMTGAGLRNACWCVVVRGRLARSPSSMHALARCGEQAEAYDDAHQLTPDEMPIYFPSCNTVQGVLQSNEFFGGKPKSVMKVNVDRST